MTTEETVSVPHHVEDAVATIAAIHAAHYREARALQKAVSRATGGIPQPFIELEAPLDEIASRLARVHDAVEQLFKSKERDFDSWIHDERRKKDLELWVPLVQFSHHGSDHRSQIGTILTLNGLDAPELDVWVYATAEGAITDF